jgi:hypothetical protein
MSAQQQNFWSLAGANGLKFVAVFIQLILGSGVGGLSSIWLSLARAK